MGRIGNENTPVPLNASQLDDSLWATQAEAQGGAVANKIMNPVRTKDVVTALAASAMYRNLLIGEDFTTIGAATPPARSFKS